MTSVEHKIMDLDLPTDGEKLAEPDLLTPDDAGWLEALRGQPIDAVWLDEANMVVSEGSTKLGPRSSEPKIASVLQARERFYGELLGWASEEHPLHNAYTRFFTRHVRVAPPVTTVIETQRLLAERRIKPVKLFAGNPALLGLRAIHVKDKLATLDGLGIDATKVFNMGNKSSDYLLSGSTEEIKARINSLSELGITEPVKAVSNYPRLLVIDWEYMLDRFSYMSELGIDAPKIVNRYPALLTYSVDKISEKYDGLTSLGLEASRVINKLPATITMSPETVEKRLRLIQRLGNILGWQQSTTDLINTSPQMLSYSKNKLLAHARIFAEHGQPDTTASQVRSMLITPLEYHLLTLMQSGDYTPANLQKTYSAKRGSNHKEQVAEIITNPANCHRIGNKVVKAYKRYAEQNG